MIFEKSNNMKKEVVALQKQLKECAATIKNFDEEVLFYSEKTSSIASHFRHVVEFFNCFFEGVESRNIDYDNRKRDKRLEMDKDFLIENVEAINDKMSRLKQLNPDERVLVYETIDGESKVASFSSISREAVFLLSHTVHHLGIIKLLAEVQGCYFQNDFGKAQSTINYEKSLEKSAA